MRTRELPSFAADGVLLHRLGVILAYLLVFCVAVPLGVWRLGGRLDALLHLPSVGALRGPGLVLLAAGSALFLSAQVWLSAAGRGLPISSLPPARLVASGPYAWVRHPIYLGFTLAVAGLGCTVGSLGHGLLAPLVLGSACWAYVGSLEGPVLRRRFGEDYREVARLGLGSRVWGFIWRRLRGRVERLANRTVLFRIGPTVWVTYGLFVALGAFLTALLGRAALGPLLPPRQYVAYAIGLALSAAVGARIASLAYNLTALRRHGLSELRVVGFVSWGGYLGLLGFTVAFGAACRIPPLALLDRLMPLLFLAMALGRLGCLTYGCCLGRPSPNGVRWTDRDAKVVRLLGADLGSVPRIPVQLLAALVGLLASALTLVLDRCDGAVGTAASCGALFYSLARLGLEQLRDETRLGSLRWTRGQWLSAGAAGLSLVTLMSLDSTATNPLQRGGVDLLALATAAAVGGLVFLIFGFHWRRVGRW